MIYDYGRVQSDQLGASLLLGRASFLVVSYYICSIHAYVSLSGGYSYLRVKGGQGVLLRLGYQLPMIGESSPVT